jgi:hypothetical protein
MSLTQEDKDWMKGWIREELHGLETRLLTEFHKWASPLEMRVKSHSAAIRAIDLELEAATGRISNLEGRV